MTMPDTLDSFLTTVAHELSWLNAQPIFIGGMIVGLFLDEVGRPQQRATDDVDCIVPTIATITAWTELTRQLLSHGWSPVREGPICR